MSLRLRLSITLGAAFVFLWAIAAAWMLFDLRSQLMLSLDQRLAASARMVAGLMAQAPLSPGDARGSRLSAEQLGIENGLACQVSSLRGEVIARSHAAPGDFLDDQRTGFHDQVIGGVPWRSFTLVENDVRVTTADRVDERITLQRSVLLAAAAPVLVALLGSLAVLWVGIARGLAPLAHIRAALAERSADSVEPLQIDGLPAELTPLVETQNLLFQRIADTIQRERRLTDNVAHELRSPLTAIKTHLQVASMTAGETARHAVEQAEIGTDRLHRTLEQLLMLARVEGLDSFEDGMPSTAIEVAHLAMEDASSISESAVDLYAATDVAHRILAMPPTLATAALRNLLDNANRHTRPGTHVSLTLESGGPDAVRFRVRDYGPGISPDLMEQLTRRFWRSDHENGSGLGLSIVKAIAERCGCKLEFEDTGNGLAVNFTIKLESAKTRRDL